MSDAEAKVRANLAKLVDEHADDDEVSFLAAQFDLGLAWVHFPEGLGGLGVSPKLQEIVETKLDQINRRYPWTRNSMGIGMVGPTIAVHGTDEQKKYLKRIWTAEDIWCQLFSEPGAGSDVAGLATKAERDGDEWVVNGQKVWTSAAHQSRYGLLIARTNPDVVKHKGITAFLIDMTTPGIDVRPLKQISGTSHFNEVYFTDARIPASAQIGALGAGWNVAVTTLMNERVSIGGVVEPPGTGPIADALAQWNKRDDKDPALRAELMKLYVESEVLRIGKMRAQQLREKGQPGPEGSVLKLQGALLQQRIGSFAVTLAGMNGTLFDYSAGRQGDRFRDADQFVGSFLGAQSSTIAGGTSEIMRNILGERVLGLPMEPRADRELPWSQVPRN
ncbi:MAG: acyl-CoA dehydrogenase family protein [Acidimicrobiia bacterium]